jgi:hypothetical protein
MRATRYHGLGSEPESNVEHNESMILYVRYYSIELAGSSRPC